MEALGSHSAEDTITLEVKCSQPSSSSSLTLRVPSHATVAEIKGLLTRAHPSHPERDAQRLIFAGRLLADGEVVDQVIPKHRVPFPLSHTMLTVSCSHYYL